MSTRQVILIELRKQIDQWVSGEALSEVLGISRTAVWKQIKVLQSEGYEIETSPRLGYRLQQTPDLLLPDELAAQLRTRVFGRQHYFYYRELESTNDRAKELASQGYPEGTVVAAEMQTAGRGRRGRGWSSAEGEGVIASIILRPVIPTSQVARIPIVVAVTTAETLIDELALPARIKWPNDILVNHKKMVGILVEASIDIESVHYMVAGIGLNINNRKESFTKELRKTATSALLETGKAYSRVQVLQSLLYHLEESYDRLLKGDFAYLIQRFRELSDLKGVVVRVDGVSSTLTGEAMDIDDEGFLLVKDDTGKIHTVTSGDVTVIKQPGYR